MYVEDNVVNYDPGRWATNKQHSEPPDTVVLCAVYIVPHRPIFYVYHPQQYIPRATTLYFLIFYACIYGIILIENLAEIIWFLLWIGTL
jgi:hypothetical protein